jgi:uncharacterized protein (TIGR00375 family)
MVIADFHIHSKYSRATSKDCVPEMLDLWARRKGLDVIGTGDFTHARWREELAEKLVPAEEGLYMLKDEFRLADEHTGLGGGARFIVSGEISSIYKKNGKVRKVHNVILLPGLEAAERLSLRLETIGNLHSDGRPILGLDSRDLLEIMLEMAPDAIFIPAHIWTPHFSLFGAYSGFDDIHECFEDLTGHIHALETGLSSDPPMNRRISALDGYTLVSNSDAHSPAKLAREANLFDIKPSYPEIAHALDGRSDGFKGTIEFFPEEGKYHFDGHRKCGVCQKPSETNATGGVCPVCGRRITTGVLHRVEELADREEGFVCPSSKPFESIVPLPEVIACSSGVSSASKRVTAQYFNMLRTLGPEFSILREIPLDDISRAAGPLIAEGVRRLREGSVQLEPGFDGEYGKIKIFEQGELRLFAAPSAAVSASQPKSVSKQASDDQTDADAQVDHMPGGEYPYGLNDAQWEAVSATESAVAVIAGPGTGKTRTLVSRIAYLVEVCGVPADQITAVTFTNKASGEMRERLAQQLADKRVVRDLHVGTFHALCLDGLQSRDIHLSVVDDQTALETMRGVLRQLGKKESPRNMLRAVSLVKSGAYTEEEIPQSVLECYNAALEEAGALDFDDILLRALERAEADGTNAPHFTHILVDEFQDVNPVQYRLIRAWGKTGNTVFVIGDPDQSIYGFRGTDPLCFEKFFADHRDARRILLTQNYRSTPEILTSAQSVLSATGSEAHPLRAVKPGGEKVHLLTAQDSFSEAVFIAKEINRMVGGMDMLQAHASPVGGTAKVQRGFGDIAVLYRTNRQTNTLEHCLLQEDIPYVVSGRHDFLSDPEVQKTLAFFRFLLHRDDVLSLKAYLKSFVRQSTALETILGEYAASRKSLCGLSSALEKHAPDLVSALSLSAERLTEYARAVRKTAPCELIKRFMRDSGLEGSREMELLLNTSVTYERMPSLLDSLTLGRERDVTRSGKRDYSPDAVSLMTLHAAKGLEFPVVFLCGVSDGLIPFRNHANECDIGEERRLFFVGMTRAKDELVLLTSPAGSPFLGDLPQDLLIRGDARPPKPKPSSKQLSLFWSFIYP